MKITNFLRKPALNTDGICALSYGFLAVIVSVLELFLCFNGPIAFTRKPSLMVFPVQGAGLTEQETARAEDFIERQIALTRSYAIVSRRFIRERALASDPSSTGAQLESVDFIRAQSVAKELGLECFALARITATEAGCDMVIQVKKTEYNEILRDERFDSSSLSLMLSGIGRDGARIDFRGALASKTKGISFADCLVLGLICIQAMVGLCALLGREPGFLVEIAWAPAFVLFLFAYIHALSANLDYVQRYIASGGQLRLAESTALEQAYAILRYGPLLLLNGAYYVLRTIRGVGRAAATAHWVRRLVTRWSLPWVMASAALFGFSFPSVLRLDGMGWLAWLSLVPLFIVLITVKPARGVFYGVLFGVLQALIVNYWLGTYDYISLHMVTIAFAAEYLAFMIVLVVLIRVSGRWGFLSASLAWVLFDYCRSVGLLGFPWGLIGTTQYRFLPLIQIASITGVWGIDFVVLLCNASIAWALAAPAFAPPAFAPPALSWNRRDGRFPLPGAFPIAVAGVVFIASLGSGAFILRSMRARLADSSKARTATIVLVQHNADPRKVGNDENLDKLVSLTDRALASLPAKPDMIAWPEGAFMIDTRYWGDPERKDSAWAGLVRRFLDYQRSLGTWLATGTQDHELVTAENGEITQKDFNSSVLLDPDGQTKGFYHKINLVPFSERFPLDKKKFAGLYSLLQTYDISDWDVGSERVVFQHEKLRFATPICFEDVFSDHVRRFVLNDVDLIVNMSEDFWSLSPVEGRQHGILALFRAVENQRPVLRSTSSGFTVSIDATGRIQPGALPAYTAGYVVATVTLPEKRLTLYTRWGDWFPLSCAAVLLLVGVFVLARIVVRKAKSRSQPKPCPFQTAGGNSREAKMSPCWNVSTSVESRKIATVCSNCAERLPSLVTRVQPSLATCVSLPPRFSIGSIVKTMPGTIRVPVSCWPKFGTIGSSCSALPMPWPT
jgi:apolipoprotein N-acyltransferase